MAFAWFKGHGTENDFVLLPDHEGTMELSAEFVRAVCDRRRGLGADGILRVVRSTAAGYNSPAEWFMDYRNADGSIAQMCGNGVRVFARHLHEQGLVDGGSFSVHTRDGLKFVTVDVDAVTVDMGPYRVGRHSKVAANGRNWAALEVNTGNPHVVALVDTLTEAGALAIEPDYDQGMFPEGVNIEFVVRQDADRARMRVWERGVGETHACGTGACAVGIALSSLDHATLPATWAIDTPGGTLEVRVESDRTLLTGPAVIVAGGTMEWFA